MKKAEITLVLLALFALLGKLLHFPGSGILIVLSLSTLSIIYFWGALVLFSGQGMRETFKAGISKLGASKIIISVTIGWALSIALIGILFKVQLWPGSRVMLTVGTMALALACIPTIIQAITTKEPYYVNALKRAVPVLVLGVMAYSISTRCWVEIRYPDNPEYVEAYMASYQDPLNEEKRAKLRELEAQMRGIDEEEASEESP